MVPALNSGGGRNPARDGATDGLRKYSLPAKVVNTGASPAAQCAIGGQVAYARTELFFGKSIPCGGTVSDTAFAQFLDQEVTPRFPAGFTVVPAMGQYRRPTE